MDKDQLRIVKRQLRESHRKIFTRHSVLLDLMFDVLTTLRETQDEMAKLYQIDDELDEATKEE